jgi:peptidoglycan/xylan/chitin deacetylase (PgdA/CDA1 family)
MTRRRQQVKSLLRTLLPRRALLVRGPRDSAEVCLTFDDGPHEEYTPAVLDALERHDAKATFFVVGARARREPSIVARIAAAQHAIGHHSFHHADPSLVCASALAVEVDESEALLYRITGARSRLFRPPHGKVTVAKLVSLWRRRQCVVLWSLDPKDFAARSVGETLAFFERTPPSAGDVILLHDVNARAARVVDELVPLIRSHGLEPARISDWL